MTETDRELLELAAKAAGIDVAAGWSVRLNAFYVEPEQETGAYAGWNPLTDDGDALRLAVKLNLRIVFHPVLNQALVREYFDNDCKWFENGEDHSDPLSATRRAITRAAAEIGKGMK